MLQCACTQSRKGGIQPSQSNWSLEATHLKQPQLSSNTILWVVNPTKGSTSLLIPEFPYIRMTIKVLSPNVQRQHHFPSITLSFVGHHKSKLEPDMPKRGYSYHGILFSNEYQSISLRGRTLLSTFGLKCKFTFMKSTMGRTWALFPPSSTLPGKMDLPWH